MFTPEELSARFKYPFSEGVISVLAVAKDESVGLKHNYIGTEHLLLGLVNACPANIMTEFNLSVATVRRGVEFMMGKGVRALGGEIDLTPRSKRVIELSIDEAKRKGDPTLVTHHIWAGLARDREGAAIGVLYILGVDYAKLAETVLRVGRLGPRGREIADQAHLSLTRLAMFFDDPKSDLRSKQQTMIALQAIAEAVYPQTKQ